MGRVVLFLAAGIIFGEIMSINLKKKVSSVFLILTVSAVAELLTNVMLGRALSVDMFGRFKFVVTVATALSLSLLFGQNTAIIKVLSKDDFGRFNWKKFLLSWIGLAGLIGIVAVGLIAHYYRLTYEVYFIYVAFITSIAAEYFSSVMRSRGSYNFSMFLSKSAAIGFCATIAVVFCCFKGISFYKLLAVYAVCSSIPVLIGIYATRFFENGHKDFPNRIIKEGLFLFLITVSYVILGQVDQFFIAKMLGYESLAGYSVMITICRGFDLISMALWFVLMPHYAKGAMRSVKSDSLKSGVLAGGMALFYVIAGGFLLHILFKGKFDGSLYLLKFFIVIGICKVLYAIPSGIIGGRLSAKYLKIFLWASLVGIVINILGNYFLIPIWGLSGSATATMVSWLFRVVVSYWLVRKEQHYQRAVTLEAEQWQSAS